MNAFPAVESAAGINWSAGVFVLLGIAVYFECRLAEIIVRIVGTFMLAGCVLSVIFLCAGLASQGTLSYGRYSTDSPLWWEVTLFILGSVISFVPPWYMLQMKVRADSTNRKRGRVAG